MKIGRNIDPVLDAVSLVTLDSLPILKVVLYSERLKLDSKGDLPTRCFKVAF